MDLEDLSCAICQELFDPDERVPRMLACGHTYCQRCLVSLFLRPPLVCPEDRHPITASTVESLAKNFALLRVIERTHEVHPHVDDTPKCPEHRKKLEYVCLDDRQKICANCALFGRHKGHNVRAEEEIMREITIRAECLFDMMQIIEKSQANVLDATVKSRLESLPALYIRRKTELESRLADCFADARARLNEMEKTAAVTLQKNFDYVEDNFVSIRDMPKLVDSQSTAWIQAAKDRLDHIGAAAEDPFHVAVDVLESGGNDLFTTGEKVMMELESLKELPIDQLEELVHGVTLEYSEELLGGLVTVRSEPRQPELAQISELRTVVNPELATVEPPSEERPRRTAPRKPFNEPVFEEAMDALRLHTSETADFTGAGGTVHTDLSERASSIVPSLASNFCLKSLKLVKNNLSDSDVAGICSVLQDNTTLQSLHIAQNAVSAEGMEAIVEMLSLNTTLREVNLMGNPKMTHDMKVRLAGMSNKYRKIYT